MRLFVLVRHGQSELNVSRRVNGDPSVPVGLTEQGEAEAAALRLQLAGIALDLCVHTRFGRSRATARIALEGRDIAVEVEPLLDDIDVGELEGRTIDDYRAWKAEHTRAGRLSRRREPGRLSPALRRRLRAAAGATGAADPRRLPRDPRPVRDQRRGRLGRARRPGARDRQLHPAPLRRERPRAGGRADPRARARLSPARAFASASRRCLCPCRGRRGRRRRDGRCRGGRRHGDRPRRGRRSRRRACRRRACPRSGSCRRRDRARAAPCGRGSCPPCPTPDAVRLTAPAVSWARAPAV